MIGDAWTDLDGITASKLNQMTIISGTGAYLATITAIENGQVVVCTSTGSGFTENHAYVWDTSAWVDLTNVSHTHTSSSDGGSIIGLPRSNTKFFDSQARYTLYPQKVDYLQTTGAGAAITDDTTSSIYTVKLDSGTTSGSGATIQIPGLKQDFSKESYFQTGVTLNSTSNIATKIGPSMETVTAADDNNVKYGIESCSVSSANWLIRSATGAARSTQDSGTAVSTAQIGFRCEHYPSTPKTDTYINNGSAITKSSDIPTTGAGTANNVFKLSIKNSTTASKTMLCHGSRIAYYVSDVWY